MSPRISNRIRPSPAAAVPKQSKERVPTAAVGLFAPAVRKNQKIVTLDRNAAAAINAIKAEDAETPKIRANDVMTKGGRT